MIGRDPWSKKKVNYLSCIEGKGDGKDIHRSAQNAVLFVDLFNISFVNEIDHTVIVDTISRF